MAKKIKFSTKDTKYSKMPKSAKAKSPNEPDEYADHSYKNREVRPDGATVYYYENGVKAIHHPKKTGSEYHRNAAKHHEKAAEELMSAKETASALAHLKARMGHRMAMKKKEDEESNVEKLYKDFGGAESGAGDIVAVASDPGIFTETYTGTSSKKKKKSSKKEIEENKKKKKKASGPDKLDKWLDETEEKTLDLIPLTKTDAKKYDIGRTGGLTPDHNIKTSMEERDPEEFMEAREKAAEDRAFGLKKTDVFSNYIVELLDDVRKELQKEDEAKESERPSPEEEYEMVQQSQKELQEMWRRKGLLEEREEENVEKMETDWSKTKKDAKLVNMPFLGMYKKSIEGRRENPPQVEKQYGTPRSPRPDKNGYRNPPNRRIPDPES